MQIHRIRYFFEHKLLQSWFYENKEQFVGMILQNKRILYRVIGDIFESEGLKNPYKEEDFGAEPIRVTDDVLVLKLIFPEPENTPLCHCVYLFFDEGFEKQDYFCVEKGEKTPFLCSWDSNGCHQNYGSCTFDEMDNIIRCAEIHMKKHYS